VRDIQAEGQTDSKVIQKASFYFFQNKKFRLKTHDVEEIIFVYFENRENSCRHCGPHEYFNVKGGVTVRIVIAVF
jgi:hypothetical protein